ncbi:LysR substrate-binding domain-containing protein [Polaromonas sp. P5_D5]
MNVLGLKTFAAVASQGGITSAAQTLHTVQSNITQRIRLLESELGLALFKRHSRGMELTRAGQRLLPYANRIVALMDEAQAAAKGEEDAPAVLTIGSMETTAAVRLPSLLAAYRRVLPQVAITLETGPTATLIEAVLTRRLDGAFIAGPLNNHALLSLVAFEEELVLVSSASWVRSSELGRRLENGAAAIMFKTGCSYRQRFEQLLSERGWPRYTRLEMGTLEGILGCVAAEVGISLLPRSIVENAANRSALRCHPSTGKKYAVKTLFIRRRDEHPGQALQQFMNLL